ncbi:MarR family winged helix-turn-helix transcriptional regulator [Streptomonospora salina]|uniref:DNA-binding MarR family transcriptional regulator n=1 Tax=Streptomonospora salina TaxID=104205 RepID=A0A841EFX5_9ACTN|nr:MarR family transcriptional regulator [Streptomonospora salina]MBB5999778.1 DNA-binding MarR family transcriptional regulator [Streptomonospora salina]
MESEEARRVNRALNKMSKLYREVKSRKLADLGLHPGQDVLLWLLAQQEGGTTVSQLAARLGIEPPTATRTLARLEKRELFRREPVPTDRRQVRIVLTEEARRLVPRIEAVWDELAEEILGGIPPEQREALVDALEDANDRLREQVSDSAMTEE